MAKSTLPNKARHKCAMTDGCLVDQICQPAATVNISGSWQAFVSDSADERGSSLPGTRRHRSRHSAIWRSNLVSATSSSNGATRGPVRCFPERGDKNKCALDARTHSLARLALLPTISRRLPGFRLMTARRKPRRLSTLYLTHHKNIYNAYRCLQNTLK